MSLRYFRSLLCVGFIFLFAACGDDDSSDVTPAPGPGTPGNGGGGSGEEETEIVITASDFSLTIDENPEENASLGSITAEVNEGTLAFAIATEDPEGSFTIDEETGELFVADVALFDYETNQELNATVEVSAEGAESQTVSVVVTLNDVNEFVGFVTTWKTESDNESITIPVNPDFSSNYNVNWGDGTNDDEVNDDATHEYAEAGTYYVEITGSFPGIKFEESTDANSEKLMTIEQWGNIAWRSFSSAFYGCANVVGNYEDTPNLSNVTNMSRAFYEATLFNGDLNDWNMSNVTNMSLMFFLATSFNQEVGSWDVGGVTNMAGMFQGASSFDQSLGSWDITAVNNMNAMLYNANLSVANYDDTLEGWSEQTVLPGVTLSAHGLEYCNQIARGILVVNWNIEGDALSADCQ
ncbi:BspA family leucine-rich repeat surface protein [Fulvivirga maritima]|uniref:BspA family leucine-rich repeat surface protein n=1 Tax=Fulvivirga maritima TaxID=2904247 RepID=UPI001F2CE716|nr:BspA family leucine-rich repeat surface protein [Fulvivirga maritima]UII27705.1 BspA family leucine-rich repeat surface protein [Fulvivirga maritima]